ncbi:hypothetical protein F5884DRAFT_679645, partial [Xylogone sp. PMI_703]
YKLVKEFLKTFYNVIKRYKSFLVNNKIFHQNISENNIIITKFTTKNDLRKKLINLDLVKKLNITLSKINY